MRRGQAQGRRVGVADSHLSGPCPCACLLMSWAQGGRRVRHASGKPKRHTAPQTWLSPKQRSLAAKPGAAPAGQGRGACVVETELLALANEKILSPLTRGDCALRLRISRARSVPLPST